MFDRAAYKLANRERLLAQKRDFYARHRDRLLAEKREVYQTNPEAYREKKKQRRAEADPTHIKKLEKADYDRRREKILAQKKVYRKTHIEQIMLASARRRAKKKGWEFNLELSDIVIPETCPLLNVPLKRDCNKTNTSRPSLDRIDSSKGYVKGNVWVISHKANSMKNDANTSELVEFSKSILSIWGSK